MARKRSAKQRAASIKNLIVARKRRRGVSRSTFKSAVAPGTVRINSRPTGISYMRNSPNKRQQKRLGRWEVTVKGSGNRRAEVGYKTYRQANRQDKVLQFLDPHGAIYKKINSRGKYRPTIQRSRNVRYYPTPKDWVINK